MLISRNLNLLKTTYRYTRLKNATTNLEQVRLGHHSGNYRSEGHPSRNSTIVANILGGFTWWWILWHLWHDYEHISGEYPFPDPSKWTDAELGIPPDNE